MPRFDSMPLLVSVSWAGLGAAMASDIAPPNAGAPVKRRHSIEWSLKTFLRGQSSTPQDSMQVVVGAGSEAIGRCVIYAFPCVIVFIVCCFICK